VLVTVARGDLVCFKPFRAILWAEIDVVDTNDGIVLGQRTLGLTREGLSLRPTDWERGRGVRGRWEGPYRRKRGPRPPMYQKVKSAGVRDRFPPQGWPLH
jgi:hypothetical protein